MHACKARYYDGLKAGSHDALVNLESDRLVISSESLPAPLEWGYAATHIKERPERDRPLMVSNSGFPEARLVIHDGSLYATLATKIPKRHAPRISIPASWQSQCCWLVCGVAIMAALYAWVPLLAEPLSKHFPAAWEESLGTSTIEVMTEGKPACTGSEGQQALDKIVTTLQVASHVNQAITVQVIRDKNVNAFATPGGHIILFSSLIDAAENPEELAGVIAHEMGHIIRRHPTQTLVRGLGLNMIISIVFSGTGDTATAATIGNQLFQLRYNRNFERQADEVATHLLYDANIDNRGLLKFFIRMQSKEKGGSELLSYASTHPPTAERIEAIKSAKNTLQSQTILTNQQWQALKNICK